VHRGSRRADTSLLEAQRPCRFRRDSQATIRPCRVALTVQRHGGVPGAAGGCPEGELLPPMPPTDSTACTSRMRSRFSSASALSTTSSRIKTENARAAQVRVTGSVTAREPRVDATRITTDGRATTGSPSCPPSVTDLLAGVVIASWPHCLSWKVVSGCSSLVPASGRPMTRRAGLNLVPLSPPAPSAQTANAPTTATHRPTAV
jgi:hypothetical protein